MRFLLSFSALFFYSTLFGQFENFNSGSFPPNSPFLITTPTSSGITYSGDPSKWYRSDDMVINNTFGNSGLNVGYGGSGNCAILYSNMFDGYQWNFQIDMVLNNINLSTYTYPQLKFYIKHVDGDEQIQISASMNGTSYNLLHTVTTNYTNWSLVTVDLSAYAGLTNVSLRFRGIDGPSHDPDATNVGIDNITVDQQTSMAYLSSTTSHSGCGLRQGFDDQAYTMITVQTQGSLSPLNLTQLNLNTTGSTNDVSDVSSKKIYYTGSSNVFSTSNLIGSSNSTGNYSITGSATLNEGANYFWLAADISSTSTLSNIVDAACTGLVINSTTYTPTITAPTGNLTINNTGIYVVTNLNDAGSGSLRQCLISAYAYNCGNAIVDARNITGTINWGAKFSGGPAHNVIILGSGANQLIINGGGAEGFIFHYGSGDLTISGLKISNCAGENAIYKPNSSGDLILENCWFDNNTYTSIYFVNSSANFSASNCTFSNNSSSNSNGVMYLPNITGSVTFSNCTFYNNSAGDYAGVMYCANITGGLLIENCSFVNNSCVNAYGGAIRAANASAVVINTTFDNNTPNAFYGPLTMNYSHMSNTSGATISGSNNILNITANLAALANNGGTTPTCAINSGSPLIDAGTSNLSKDQRGYSRNGTSDIGAYEYSGVPLPVELISLNTNCLTNAISINWETASEYNSAYFDVEKSRDGSNWSLVNTIPAAGNSITTINYSVLDDENSENELVYYRLHQYDLDGNTKVYGPISSMCEGSTDFDVSIYPNPSNGNVTFKINNSIAQTIEIKLIGADGKNISTVKKIIDAGINILPISFSSLKSGMYVVKIISTNKVYNQQLIIEH
jgi:hypothetical protein